MVVVFELTFPVRAIPGLANAVFAVAEDLSVAQPESKYRVTVDPVPAVPRIVGVRLDPGSPPLTDENEMLGGVILYVTVLSVAVDAALVLPKASVTMPEAMVGITVPVADIPEAVIVQLILSMLVTLKVTPVALPDCATSAPVNVPPATADEKTAV